MKKTEIGVCGNGLLPAPALTAIESVVNFTCDIDSMQIMLSYQFLDGREGENTKYYGDAINPASHSHAMETVASNKHGKLLTQN